MLLATNNSYGFLARKVVGFAVSIYLYAAFVVFQSPNFMKPFTGFTVPFFGTITCINVSNVIASG